MIMQQFGLSVFNITVHSLQTRERIEITDSGDLYSMRREFEFLHRLDALGEGLNWDHGYRTTQHFMWGQNANYYSHLYSRVFVTGIFYYAFLDGLMNAGAG
ncbi:hypothetical protein B0O99DRAFT_630038 [Bisporella sp. PMI_857]|nr:hypothetical protein B0O99DRAFT_630038 [Bisporella sp. PMI_857]